MTPKRFIIGLLFLIILGTAGGLIAFANTGNYQPAQALLTVSSGTAVIIHVNNENTPVIAGKSVSVTVGDSVHMLGHGTLAFAGAQIDLEQDARLTLKTYLASGGEAQIDLNVDSGPTFQHVLGYRDIRSRFTITTPTSQISTRSAEFTIWLAQHGPTEIGMFAGTAFVSKADGSARVTLQEGQGIILAVGSAPAPPTSWSKVRVQLYGPDGLPRVLPVKLMSNLNSEDYNISSGQLIMLPTGMYSLYINLLLPYVATGLVLDPKNVNTITVTLSQIMFSTVNGDQTPVGQDKLLIKVADKTEVTTITSGDWLLVSPGSWKLNAARAESPDAWQTFKIDVAPGQQWSAALAENMFGAGNLRVTVIAPRQANLDAVDVWVYRSGEENADPFLKFKADGAPQMLAQGKYVVSVRTRIAFRQEITIGLDESKSITVQVAGLAVNYSDDQGNPVPRDLYIASSSEMKRLDISIFRMNRTPYGVTVDTNVKLWVPVGTYSLLVDESPDIIRSDVVVTAGQTTTINLKAPQ